MLESAKVLQREGKGRRGRGRVEVEASLICRCPERGKGRGEEKGAFPCHGHPYGPNGRREGGKSDGGKTFDKFPLKNDNKEK